MAEPTKQETEQIFKVLKAQKANKVLTGLQAVQRFLTNKKNSLVLTAMHEIQLGLVSPSASTSVWTAQVCIETWVSISASSGIPRSLAPTE